MATVGICGTDLHVVKDEWQRPRPMVLGHEGAGIVEAVGEGVESVARGRRRRAFVGAIVRGLSRLPARPASRVPPAPVRDRRRHADRRHDGDDARRGDALSRHGDRSARRAARRLRAGRPPARRCGAPRPGGAARLRRADRGWRRALRGGRRGGLDGARDRGGRRRPVRRPGREDRWGVRDRLLRSGLRAARARGTARRDARGPSGRARRNGRRSTSQRASTTRSTPLATRRRPRRHSAGRATEASA